MNLTAKKSLPPWLLFVLGALLVVQFAGLGAWQVSRGLEKSAQRAMFADESGFSSWSEGMEISAYQALQVTGHYVDGRQFLLDNIIIGDRFGYYVVTPLDVGGGQPLMLVNRGWIKRDGADFDGSQIDLVDTRVTVRGRAGALPKVGSTMHDSIVPGSPWPKHAVYPTLGELSSALGRDVQPFVLLMDPNDAGGFLRHWILGEMTPGKHFGYALQWFGTSIILAAILVWNYRTRRKRKIADEP